MIHVLPYIVEFSFCLLVLMGFYRLFLARLTFFGSTRIYLLSALGFSLILPLFDFQFGVSGNLPINTISSIGIAGSQIIKDESESIPFLSIQVLLPALYFGGLIWMLVRLMIGLFRTMRLIQNSEKKHYQGVQIALNPVFRPASFFSTILLPTLDLEDRQFQQIIIHESVHIREGHSFDILLVQLVKSIMWFNPLIYVFENLLKEVHEFQADQQVTLSHSSIDYSRTLVQILNSNRGLQLLNNFNQFQTKKRIIMMHKEKSKESKKGVFLFGIPVLAMLFFLISCSSGVDRPQLVGTWTGSDFEFEQTEGADMSAMIEGGKMLHVDGKLILEENGNYQILAGQGDMNGSGTWELGSDDILTTFDGQESTAYSIVSLTDQELITKHEVAFESPMGKLAGIITLTYKR